MAGEKRGVGVLGTGTVGQALAGKLADDGSPLI